MYSHANYLPVHSFLQNFSLVKTNFYMYVCTNWSNLPLQSEYSEVCDSVWEGGLVPVPVQGWLGEGGASGLRLRRVLLKRGTI